MIHSLKSIAKIYKFDEKDFIAFTMKFGDHISWEENGQRVTNTWNADEVINNYRNHLEEKQKSC